ncbi:peptidoglycan-binding protein, partial [Klebsiella pneumoniae]|nr:peptidoglycan-binding protein [Klebsiella pneumoniae]
DGIAGDKTLTLLYSSDAVDSDEYATLRPGDTGAAVRTMQATLYELGYYDGSRDGVYGATTQDAVRAVQIRNKVTPVDSDEYATLRPGDTGAAVRT